MLLLNIKLILPSLITGETEFNSPPIKYLFPLTLLNELQTDFHSLLIILLFAGGLFPFSFITTIAESGTGIAG